MLVYMFFNVKKQRNSRVKLVFIWDFTNEHQKQIYLVDKSPTTTSDLY